MTDRTNGEVTFTVHEILGVLKESRRMEVWGHAYIMERTNSENRYQELGS